MGGGYVTRPNFENPTCDPSDPMSEFYGLLQRALSQSGLFALPGAYMAFRPPLDRQIYQEDIWDYCTLYSCQTPGLRQIFAPHNLRVVFDELLVLPGGTPSGLLLTDEQTHRSTALRILPPPGCPEPALPPLPEAYSTLTLRLTEADLLLADADPARLGRQLAGSPAQKSWVRHPAIDQWVMQALSVAQRSYRRRG